MPSVLSRRLTLSSEPRVLRTVARMLRPTSRAASFPCSADRSAPTLPATGELASSLAGPCPDTYKMCPHCTAGLYLATGLGGVGNVIFNSCKRFSADIVVSFCDRGVLPDYEPGRRVATRRAESPGIRLGEQS